VSNVLSSDRGNAHVQGSYPSELASETAGSTQAPTSITSTSTLKKVVEDMRASPSASPSVNQEVIDVAFALDAMPDLGDLLLRRV
jgi:hypothetical protein